MSTVSVDRTQPRNYGYGSARYYGVTTICHAMTGEPHYGSDGAMQRGSDLHAIFALSVASSAGRCPPPSVPMDYRGYHQSMLSWIDTFKPDPVLIEVASIASGRYPFAGTPDLLAWIQYRGRRVLAVVDLKSGQPMRWHATQVLAYSKLQHHQGATTRGLLYLHADGSAPTYQTPKTNPHDWAAFHAALNLLIWRESL